MNESAVGRTTAETLRLEGLIGRLDYPQLRTIEYCLPSLREQSSFLESYESLNRVRAELDELQMALWSDKDSPANLAERIKTVNREDRYEDWLDSLPFPLASILWRHRASSGPFALRYPVLLHFFEATAAFLATVHLSAFMSDEGLWTEEKKGLLETLGKQKLSLDRATFGTWKLSAEYLVGRCRALMQTAEGLETCKRIYGTSDENHLELLTRSEMLSVLQRANSLRNGAHAHGGAVGEDEAKQLHDELLGLVQKLRGAFGRRWADFELIQPSECKYRSGVYNYKAKRLLGTRTPFESVERQAAVPLESDRLYLYDSIGRRGLLLQPFIRVMPSPEKRAVACFIFSRRERSGSHFVSYHFEEESSLTATVPEVDEALGRIRFMPVAGAA